MTLAYLHRRPPPTRLCPVLAARWVHSVSSVPPRDPPPPPHPGDVPPGRAMGEGRLGGGGGTGRTPLSPVCRTVTVLPTENNNVIEGDVDQTEDMQ